MDTSLTTGSSVISRIQFIHAATDTICSISVMFLVGGDHSTLCLVVLAPKMTYMIVPTSIPIHQTRTTWHFRYYITSINSNNERWGDITEPGWAGLGCGWLTSCFGLDLGENGWRLSNGTTSRYPLVQFSKHEMQGTRKQSFAQTRLRLRTGRMIQGFL